MNKKNAVLKISTAFCLNLYQLCLIVNIQPYKEPDLSITLPII